MKIKGAQAVIECLLKEKVEIIFGYPGGANIPIYDVLYDYKNKLKHVLVRHEQAAAHAAEGYARITGKPGVCLVTSGPGATNLITGIADAMMDSVPLVCITGQVAANFLGDDAFQETDVMGITTPITKWNYQITKADEIPDVFAKAFFIANHGRPGPVVIDITKNAQIEDVDFFYPKIKMKKLIDVNHFNNKQLKEAADLINTAKRPFLLAGHGVLISKAEKEVNQLVKKAKIPSAVTLHGISIFSKNNQYYVGMVGMHGHYAPNVLTNQADLIIALGMRFDDRVTGKLDNYAPKARIIHVDIDNSEHNKNVKTYLSIIADVKTFLKKLIPLIKSVDREGWLAEFRKMNEKEKIAENKREKKFKNQITSDYVIKTLSKATDGRAIVVADVGQHQMFAARYYDFNTYNSFISSGGLGTMGFGVPAAIGVKLTKKRQLVVAVVGDGGFQMNVQELGTIMQEKLPVKILILNNQYLGMVRQWQELFFNKRYSFTYLKNPDFIKLAESYGIKAKKVVEKRDLEKTLKEFVSFPGPYLLEVKVALEYNVFPMVPVGKAVDEVILE